MDAGIARETVAGRSPQYDIIALGQDKVVDPFVPVPTSPDIIARFAMDSGHFLSFSDTLLSQQCTPTKCTDPSALPSLNLNVFMLGEFPYYELQAPTDLN
jgi:hypothetical protein